MAAWFSDRISPLDILAMSDTDRGILIACQQARSRREDQQAADAKRQAERQQRAEARKARGG